MKAVALVPVRNGVRCVGSTDAVALAGGHVYEVRFSIFDARHIATSVVAAIDRTIDVVVVPGSPDGRDLAPHLADQQGRELYSSVIAFDDQTVTCSRHGGRSQQTHKVTKQVVFVLQQGLGMTPIVEQSVATIDVVARPETAVRLVAERPADPATMDLAEAPRIVGAGIGLGTHEAVNRLADLAHVIGASVGGTRVVTDLGWLPFERQIGTTGVTVDPRLYINFGVSGAVQHVTGLGAPDHIISVNTDAACPMMAMADVAVVADASSVLAELVRQLAQRAANRGTAQLPYLGIE